MTMGAKWSGACSSLEKSSRYTAGGFFTDTAGVFKVYHQNVDANTETTVPMHSVVDASSKSQWLVLVRPQGVVEVSGHSVLYL